MANVSEPPATTSRAARSMRRFSWPAVLPALLRRRLELVLPASGELPRVARALSSTAPERVPEQEAELERNYRSRTTTGAGATGSRSCERHGAEPCDYRPCSATTGLDGGTTGTGGDWRD